MSFRSQKVSQEILELLSSILVKELKDPRIDSLVSITDVQVTKDLSYATIYISKIASPEEKREILEILNNAKGFLRSILSKKMKLRSVPELKFELDNSLEYGQKIESILNQINKGKSYE